MSSHNREQTVLATCLFPHEVQIRYEALDTVQVNRKVASTHNKFALDFYNCLSLFILMRLQANGDFVWEPHEFGQAAGIDIIRSIDDNRGTLQLEPFHHCSSDIRYWRVKNRYALSLGPVLEVCRHAGAPERPVHLHRESPRVS